MKPRQTTVRKLIETPTLLAIFDVPALIVPELPNEPLLEPKTVKLLEQARKRAVSDDRAWLRRHGARLFTSAASGR